MKEKVIYIATKLLVVVVLLTALVVTAVGKKTPSVTMTPFAEERARISVENLNNSTAELTIEDEEGFTVFYREGNIESEGFNKVFDFKNLTDGVYKVSLTSDRETENLYFEVADSEILVEKKESELLPFFDVKDDVLRFSMLNYNGGEVSMAISDDYGVLFDKELGSDFSITAGFNINKLVAGNYEVSLTNGDDTYYYTFKR